MFPSWKIFPRKFSIYSSFHALKRIISNKDSNIPWAGFLRENYVVGNLLGKGKFGEVYECSEIDEKKSDKKLGVKILNSTVKIERVKLEIDFIMKLQGGPNMIVLEKVMMDKENMSPAIVFQLFDSLPFKEVYRSFSIDDHKQYLHGLLKALEFVHSKGIMHRDIKISNALFHKSKKEVRLIDWGLAEHYSPSKAYSVRVCTRCYKAPELLIDAERKHYTQAIDIWGVGCIMATLLFHSMPFFRAKENDELLLKIVNVLGTEDFHNWTKKSNLKVSDEMIEKMGNAKKVPWTSLIGDSNSSVVSLEALNLLDKLLCYNPKDRLTAKEALDHPYFQSVRDAKSSNKS
jgi:casein kinase II subunit alpha